MRKYGKFAVLMAIIIGSLLWIATASVSGSKTYYVTIPELRKMGNEASVSASAWVGMCRAIRSCAEPVSYVSISCRTS